ncbi:uncharacterized protein JCM15063_004082 [Sporobolomyces koalae]|uniref:uncharacterized protein n=1 Tax=Sporobolomyces koalae TaxID=500713 RepID=UPI0031784D99
MQVVLAMCVFSVLFGGVVAASAPTSNKTPRSPKHRRYVFDTWTPHEHGGFTHEYGFENPLDNSKGHGTKSFLAFNVVPDLDSKGTFKVQKEKERKKRGSEQDSAPDFVVKDGFFEFDDFKDPFE